MRRGLVPPLFEFEREPGQAVRQAMDMIHPFTKEAVLPPMLVHNIMQVAHAPDAVLLNRDTAVQYWRRRAVELIPRSDSELRAVPDSLSRRLL